MKNTNILTLINENLTSVYRPTTCCRCGKTIATKENALKVKADSNGNNYKYVCLDCIKAISENRKFDTQTIVYGLIVKNKTITTINCSCKLSAYNIGLLLANGWDFEILENSIHAHGVNNGHKQCKARIINDLENVSDINYSIRCGCGCGKHLTTTDYSQTKPSIVGSFAYSIKMHR